MTIDWDPKIKPGTLPVTPGPTRADTPARTPARVPEQPHEAPRTLETVGSARTHPSRRAPDAGPDVLAQRIAELRHSLRGNRTVRMAACEEALALCASALARRARSARRASASLLDAVAESLPAERPTVRELLDILSAEDLLSELTAEGTLHALNRLVVHLDQPSSRPELGALARATMGGGLMQLVLHFPLHLEELELDAASAVAHALLLGEEAIALAPSQADAHCLLGRVLLAHDGPEALDDALEVLRHAHALDGEHDGAELALAAALRARGDSREALRHVEAVLKRGNPRPEPLLLRAQLRLDDARASDAVRDLERALRLAPDLEVLQQELARAQRASGDRGGSG